MDNDADLEKATPIIINSKAQRPGVCNALEGILIHQDIADSYLPELAKAVKAEGVILLGCKKSVALVPDITPAMDSDWGTEFLDLRLCVKIVKDMDEAFSYIEEYLKFQYGDWKTPKQDNYFTIKARTNYFNPFVRFKYQFKKLLKKVKK